MNVIMITGISMALIAFVLGVVLFWASKKFAVQENPLIDEVEALLPGANCGGCGWAGCRAFAEAVVTTKNSEMKCPVASKEVMAEIAGKLGFELSLTERMIARVACQGGVNSVKESQYVGIQSCMAAKIAGILDLVCPYGCMGYGDCVRACPFDAIHIINGVAITDEDKCTGCGLCVRTCPNKLISLTPYSKKIFVACKSTDSAASVKKYCSKGCIGCKLCMKACNYEAVEVESFLSRIKPDKCTQCGACVEKCPTKSIIICASEENTFVRKEVEENANV